MSAFWLGLFCVGIALTAYGLGLKHGERHRDEQS